MLKDVRVKNPNTTVPTDTETGDWKTHLKGSPTSQQASGDEEGLRWWRRTPGRKCDIVVLLRCKVEVTESSCSFPDSTLSCWNSKCRKSSCNVDNYRLSIINTDCNFTSKSFRPGYSEQSNVQHSHIPSICIKHCSYTTMSQIHIKNKGEIHVLSEVFSNCIFQLNKSKDFSELVVQLNVCLTKHFIVSLFQFQDRCV